MNLEKLNPMNWFNKSRLKKRRIPIENINSTTAYTNHSKQTKQLKGILSKACDKSASLVSKIRRIKYSLPFKNSSNLNSSSSQNTRDGQIITFDASGISEPDLKLKVSDNSLTISASKRYSVERKGTRSHILKRGVAAFYQIVPLPKNADKTNIRAYLENGILNVHIPQLARQKI